MGEGVPSLACDSEGSSCSKMEDGARPPGVGSSGLFCFETLASTLVFSLSRVFGSSFSRRLKGLNEIERCCRGRWVRVHVVRIERTQD